MPKNSQLPRVLTWIDGTALAICAVLGCGILILPALTAQQAGPAALIAWVVMSLLTFPIVISLARLAVIKPQAGGIIAYVRLAFGPLAGRITGWVLLGSAPIGVPAIVLTGAHYLSFFYPLTHNQIVLIATLLLAISLLLNIHGIQVTAKTGIAIVLIILTLLLTTIFSSLPMINRSSFAITAPIEWSAVGQVAVVIFFCYSGWEMVVSLAEEFRHPARDIALSLFLSAFLIALLYVSLSAIMIGTKAYEVAPLLALTFLMTQNLGPEAGAITALLAAAICFASAHANIAGFSRMLYAQSRSGDLPLFLSRLHSKYQTPYWSILSLGTFFGFVLIYYYLFRPDLGSLLALPSACFLASYILAMASAAKILPKQDPGRLAGIIAFMVCSIVYVFSGWTVIGPILLACAGWLYSATKLEKTALKL